MHFSSAGGMQPNGYHTGRQTEWYGFEPWPGQCFVFLSSKPLYSHNDSLHPGVYM